MKQEILYEDEAILICRKQAGIATQTGRIGQQDMESLLRNYRADKGEEPYIGIVQRLDQPVEGVMVFAKTRRAAAELSGQIRERRVGKHYYAVSLSSDPAGLPPQGRLVDFVAWDRRSNLARIVDAPQTGRSGRTGRAVLEYRIPVMDEGRVLFDVRLYTGRHHQIRVQLAHMGCPILGDGKYGKAELRQGPLALCSYRLEFDHPLSGERMDVSVEPEHTSIRALLALMPSRPVSVPEVKK